MQTIDFEKLAAPFSPDQISWRAQSVTKDGTKAMALAYIDARDVMHRLNEVVGVANWQCRYSHADKKTICEIGIKIGDEWVWKANGAGDTDVEAEKGALSDAFKRAAVMWGIGLSLYDMPAPWVRCESYEKNGKKMWSKWLENPADFVKFPASSSITPSVFKNAATRRAWCDSIIKLIEESTNADDLQKVYLDNAAKLKQCRDGQEHDTLAYEELMQRFSRRKAQLIEEEESIARIKQQLGE